MRPFAKRNDPDRDSFVWRRGGGNRPGRWHWWALPAEPAGGGWMSRVVHGAVAGFCATMAMTAAMRLLHRRLDAQDEYPLPPREITQEVLDPREENAATCTLLAHFHYGALAGALYGLLPRHVPGVVFGPLVWAVSYLGWIPLVGILKPATHHPAERNLLMLAAHLIWGACTAVGVRELEASSRSIFTAGRLKDRRKEE